MGFLHQRIYHFDVPFTDIFIGQFDSWLAGVFSAAPCKAKSATIGHSLLPPPLPVKLPTNMAMDSRFLNITYVAKWVRMKPVSTKHFSDHVISAHTVNYYLPTTYTKKEHN